MNLSIEHTNDSTKLYARHAKEFAFAGASAFGRDVEEFAPQVASRFEAASLAQVIKLGGDVVGFALYDVMRSSFGDVLCLEGRALRPEVQRRGIGSQALRLMATKINMGAVVTITRNPATVRLIGNNFQTVSPDLGARDPLHLAEDETIVGITLDYARRIGAKGESLPIVRGRYEAHGLYGGEDPGRKMPLAQVAQHLANAVIVTGLGRK